MSTSPLVFTTSTDGPYSSEIKNLPSGKTRIASGSTPFGSNGIGVWVVADAYKRSSPASLLKPVRRRPRWSVRKMVSRSWIVPSVSLKRTMNGENSGKENVRRSWPSIATTPFGPRSEMPTNSSIPNLASPEPMEGRAMNFNPFACALDSVASVIGGAQKPVRLVAGKTNFSSRASSARSAGQMMANKLNARKRAADQNTLSAPRKS